MFSEVILWGQKQIIKMYVTDVTSYLWLSILTTLLTRENNQNNYCKLSNVRENLICANIREFIASRIKSSR